MIHVGTHTSIAQGPELAFERSAALGGDTLQIFAKSPRGRKIPEYSEEQYVQGSLRRAEYGQVGGIVHANYLANLSKPTDEISREIQSIVHDFKLAHQHGYGAVNVHVGKLKGFDTLDEALQNMRNNVQEILDQVNKAGYGDVQYLFENTAGQGSEIGSTLDQLAYFWQKYLYDLPVKFCIDTAHCQGGGIDINQWEEFVTEFDERIGIEQLHSIHLNDSKVLLGSNLDRHASLGRGFIGRPALAKVVSRAAEYERHLYIETPEPDLWPDEIEKVRKIAEGDTSWIDEFHTKYYKTQFLKKFSEQAEGQGGLF